jgi:hypothetical protein
MNSRPLLADADGSFVLRTGRIARLLLVINGETTCEAVEKALSARGFDRPGVSAPGDWSQEAPSDWPREPIVQAHVNECLVRASGLLRGAAGAPAVRIERDAPVGDGATFTVAAAWDYGEPRSVETSGAAAPASKSASAAKASGGGKVIAGVLLGGIGLGVWHMARSSKRLEREEERYAKLRGREEIAELEQRVQGFIDPDLVSPEIARHLPPAAMIVRRNPALASGAHELLIRRDPPLTPAEEYELAGALEAALEAERR